MINILRDILPAGNPHPATSERNEAAMLITCEEMRHAEEAAFARGVQAEDLMEEAGRGVAEIVRQFHQRPRDLHRLLWERSQCWRRIGGGALPRVVGLGDRRSFCVLGSHVGSADG